MVRRVSHQINNESANHLSLFVRRRTSVVAHSPPPAGCPDASLYSNWPPENRGFGSRGSTPNTIISRSFGPFSKAPIVTRGPHREGPGWCSLRIAGSDCDMVGGLFVVVRFVGEGQRGSVWVYASVCAGKTVPRRNLECGPAQPVFYSTRKLSSSFCYRSPGDGFVPVYARNLLLRGGYAGVQRRILHTARRKYYHEILDSLPHEVAVVQCGTSQHPRDGCFCYRYGYGRGGVFWLTHHRGGVVSSRPPTSPLSHTNPGEQAHPVSCRTKVQKPPRHRAPHK